MAAGIAPSAARKPQSTAGLGLSLLQDALLVVLSGFFAYLHLHAVVVDGTLKSAPFALEQMMLVGMFLTRRRTSTTSRRPLDWLVAVGAWTPLLFQPDEGHGLVVSIGTAVQLVGLFGAIVGFAYLGRSFGVVAANRGLKINGPYRLVRHPIYAAHFLTSAGFLISNLSAVNIALFGLLAFCQVMRIRAEERVLSETADYASYRAAVRWRLVPGVY